MGQGSVLFTNEPARPDADDQWRPYTLVYDTGMADRLQNINSNLDGNYALATPVDATGFRPLTSSAVVGLFTGPFQWAGEYRFQPHPGSNRRRQLRRPRLSVGMFGGNSGVIANFGLVGGSVTDTDAGGNAGTLVGFNTGTIINSYATTSITGDIAGGLVGTNAFGGTVSTSYASGAVTGGTGPVGGLDGQNAGALTNVMATGSVSSGGDTGGLAGLNSGSITQAYASGAVAGGSGTTGGLVGVTSGGTIASGYYNATTSGEPTGTQADGSVGKINTDIGTALPAGFDTAVWGNINNQTTPYLQTNPGPVTLGSDGSATPATWNLVFNAAELTAINNNMAGNYLLAQNIDLSSAGNWTPIGEYDFNTDSFFIPVPGQFQRARQHDLEPDDQRQLARRCRAVRQGSDRRRVLDDRQCRPCRRFGDQHRQWRKCRRTGRVHRWGHDLERLRDRHGQRRQQCRCRRAGRVPQQWHDDHQFLCDRRGERRQPSRSRRVGRANQQWRRGDFQFLCDRHGQRHQQMPAGWSGSCSVRHDDHQCLRDRRGCRGRKRLQMGGLVGDSQSGVRTITNAYASGAVTDPGAAPGGLVGASNGSIANGYYNADRAGAAVTSGVGTLFGGGASATGLSGSDVFTLSKYAGFTASTTPGASGNAWVIVDDRRHAQQRQRQRRDDADAGKRIRDDDRQRPPAPARQYGGGRHELHARRQCRRDDHRVEHQRHDRHRCVDRHRVRADRRQRSMRIRRHAKRRTGASYTITNLTINSSQANVGTGRSCWAAARWKISDSSAARSRR